MAAFERTTRTARLLAGVAAAALPLTMVACGSEQPERVVGVDDVRDSELFATDKVLNETVTIDAEVSAVLTTTSFELHAPDLGDESLLVVSAIEHKDITEDDAVTVTGIVREFVYDEFDTDYKLAEKTLYEPYDSEQFLVAEDIAKHG